MIFAGKVKELPDGRLAFFTEIFKLKDTIVLKVVPQIVLAAVVGLLANVVKIAHCGDDVESNEECDVTFNLDGHLGVSVVLSFLLVFRADLAWNRYEQGKSALGAVHGGIRNLNVACATFLRKHSGLSNSSSRRRRSIAATRRRTLWTPRDSRAIGWRFFVSRTFCTRSFATPFAGNGTDTATSDR